jgi:hypothetical protein
MQDENISQSGSGRDHGGNAKDDALWQRAVLGRLLDEYPHLLMQFELERMMLGATPIFAARDGFERAVEDLIRAGLLQRCEAMILLTGAARHFASLELS